MSFEAIQFGPSIFLKILSKLCFFLELCVNKLSLLELVIVQFDPDSQGPGSLQFRRFGPGRLGNGCEVLKDTASSGMALLEL